MKQISFGTNKYKILGLLVATSMVLLLSACGASDKTDSSTETKSEKKISDSSKVIITGDISEVIEGESIGTMMVCEKNGAALRQNELSVTIHQGLTKKRLTLEIPMQSLKLGTQKVIGSHDGNPKSKLGVTTINYMGLKYNTYKKNGEGSITLTSIPTKVGEYLTGTLKGSVTKKDKKINIDAKFNIKALSYAFNKCKYGEAYTK